MKILRFVGRLIIAFFVVMFLAFLNAIAGEEEEV